MAFATRRYRTTRPNSRGEEGQTIILVCLGLGLFLLAFIGLAVDFGNFWFHRQTAQGAADAACQAGAMDMLLDADGASSGTEGFVPGTAFSCSGGSGSADSVGCKNTDSHCPNAVPCKYAALNGYDGGGLTANTPSNDVSVTFPAGVPGVTTPPSAVASTPFIKVQITDRVQTYFSRLITGSATQDVIASAKCGLVIANAPIPIVVLRHIDSGTFSKAGNSTVFIAGGPQKSIQVNSSDTGAVTISGTSGKIDLSSGGPAYTGSDLGVFGAEANPGISKFLPGTTGHWISPASPINDPFQQVATPSQPLTTPSSSHVLYHDVTAGCPDYSNGCTRYGPGYYPSGIQVGGGSRETAVFDPGIYYLGAPNTGPCKNFALCLLSNSTVRPSNAPASDANNPGGTMFFLTGTNGLSVNSNSGTQTSCPPTPTSGCVDSYQINPSLACPGQSAPTVKDYSTSPPTIVTQVDGNVLVGVCSASGSYGDGSNPATATDHGMLFFQDRSGSGANVSFGGGGGLLTAGNMYFHHCNASGTGTSCLKEASGGWNDIFTLQGGSGSGTFVLGDIIVDQLALGGNPNINMLLDPQKKYNVLKATLLQ